MRVPIRPAVTAIAACVLPLVACSDVQPTAPASSAVTSDVNRTNLLGGLLGGTTTLVGEVVDALVPPVERRVPLASDVTWSFWAGPLGATSSNASVGLTISIPRGALASTQRITVTALAGAPVAYKFEPHGLVFAKSSQLRQDLKGTTADGLLDLGLLYGAYFATDRLELTSGGLAVVTEIIPALTSLLTKTVSFPIEHFSGYIVASGRSRTLDAETEGY